MTDTSLMINDSQWASIRTKWDANEPTEIEYQGETYVSHVYVCGPVVMPDVRTQDGDDYYPRVDCIFVRLQKKGQRIIKMDHPVLHRSDYDEAIMAFLTYSIDYYATGIKNNRFACPDNDINLTQDYIENCIKRDFEWTQKECKE
jgi:hypothetical protein